MPSYCHTSLKDVNGTPSLPSQGAKGALLNRDLRPDTQQPKLGELPTKMDFKILNTELKILQGLKNFL